VLHKSRFSKCSSLAAIVAAAIVLAAPLSGQASFEIRINTASGSATITDGGAGDLNPLANNITFVYADAAYSVIGNGASTNTPGAAIAAIVDLQYSFTALAGGVATLKTSADGFNNPVGNPLTLTSILNGNGLGGGTIQLNQYADPTGTLFGLGNSPGNQGPYLIDPSYQNTSTTTFNGSNGYSITDVITVNLASGSITTGDALSKAQLTTPAPAGLLLVVAGAPIMVGVRAWRGRRLKS
jgi:hypothetical protein